jgi:hypothetical protein
LDHDFVFDDQNPTCPGTGIKDITDSSGKKVLGERVC